MGGCVGSKLGGDHEGEVVGICRERKRLMKLLLERRYALADSHCRYSHSLYSISAAIKLFVARHSTPTSPFLITFPPPNCPPTESVTAPQENVITNPMFLQQKPSEPTKEAVLIPPCGSPSDTSPSSSECDEDDEEEEEQEEMEEVKQHQHPYNSSFYMGVPLPMPVPVPPPMPSPEGGFGWDFFNPFFGVSSEVNLDEVLRRVKEEEGIPDLEEEEVVMEELKEVVVDDVKENGDSLGDLGCEDDVVKKGGDGDVGHEGKDSTPIDNPVRGRELLDALKDIEDHFIRAHDSGKDVSRLLEANKMQFTSGLEEIKENSTKLIRAITWHGCNIARSSSCKSLAVSRSRKSSSWSEYKNELIDCYGGMVSGRHSLTLGRLYAWEKKLYEEVKVGDNIRKLYEKKSTRLRSKDVRGVSTRSLEKSRASVDDLYSQILVTTRRVESISERIQKLITKELQPQITELLHGLAESWKIMLESHETQMMIISEVKTYDCPTYGKFSANSHRLATLQLEAEIRNWQESFCEHVAAQKSYIEGLQEWLSKFMVPEIEFYSKGRSSLPPFWVDGPSLYTICKDWLCAMENLPDKAVSVAMKSFVKDTRALWVQQGEEQEQKRKVEKLAKELDKKILAYKKAECRVDEPKLLEYKPNSDAKKEEYMQHRNEQPIEEDTTESFRRRLAIEKERHHSCMQEMQRMTLNGFQTGFGFIFESMVQFTRAYFKIHNDLVTSSQNSGVDGSPSCAQGSHFKKDELKQ